MINQFFTLFRGAVNSTTEEFTNQHALLILQQQMRDCAQAVTTARKAVAIAMAQNQQEIEQHKKFGWPALLNLKLGQPLRCNRRNQD